jgi:hypothetical protein
VLSRLADFFCFILEFSFLRGFQEGVSSVAGEEEKKLKYT